MPKLASREPRESKRVSAKLSEPTAVVLAVPGNDDLPIGLHHDVHGGVERAVLEHDVDHAPGAKRPVRRAVGVQAHQLQPSDHQDLPVTLERHADATTKEIRAVGDGRDRAPVIAERGVQTSEGARVVQVTAMFPTFPPLTVPVPFRTEHAWRGLLGWASTRTSYSVRSSRGDGKVKGPSLATVTVCPASASRRTNPDPWSPLHGSADGERGRRRHRLIVVEDGERRLGWIPEDGAPLRGGQPEDQSAVAVDDHVVEHRNLEELSAGDAVPETDDGVHRSVVEPGDGRSVR